MEQRALGRTGLTVSAVGYGGWGMGGGEMWRDLEPRDAQRALYLAVESGASLLDTALVYGDGQSEILLGQVVRDLRARDRVVGASKVPPADGHWPARPGSRLCDAFPEAYLVRSVEQSLRNLKLDAIPLEQLHVWHDDWLDQSAWPSLCGTMERLVREGKVLHWGVSVNDHAPASALRVVDQPLIESIQVIYNIFDPSAAAELLPRASAANVAVLARCPFDEGALTGTITADSRFPDGDFRARYFAGTRAAEVAERTSRLAALLGDEATSLAELALRFSLSHDAISAVIPGMRRARHVTANLACGDGRRLSARLLAALAEHAWDKNWYDWS
jgi:aryl-alcohol dehydrogenase-like predicted oxidoreductase